MKKLLTVLCILVLALCLTGIASAEDCQHDYQHDYTHWDDVINEEIHVLVCRDCGAEYHHSFHPHYEGLSNEEHLIFCDECGKGWSESHVGLCCDNGENGNCLYCGAYNVVISTHEGHPDRAEVAEYLDEDSHEIRCGICGDYLGRALHFSDCSGDERCADCGAEGVNIAYSDHVTRMVDFDEDCCYYRCSCGEYSFEVWHGVYCNSEDQNTCAECGKNIEDDGIIISTIWHDTKPGYSETHCWTECKACGYRPYYAEHYIGCNDEDDTHCANCWRTEEDGIILVWKHTGLDHDDWEENDIVWHRQVCWACDYAGEAHEVTLIFTPIEDNVDFHGVRCSGCEFDWQENHYAVCGEEKCADCGAENVRFVYHTDHPEDDKTYVYDADGHSSICGICEDDLGWEEHVADCSDLTRCKICGAEDVSIFVVEHDTQYADFDTELCYYSCACGEEAYNWQHVVYCDSDDGTCVGCGKSVEDDGIVISVIWHRDHTDHNEDECWNTCDNCGELYRGVHYFSCSDEDQQYCGFCGASCEEVNIWSIRHDDIDMNDLGDGWHDPWCNDCGEHLSEPHEFSLYFENGGYEICRVYCETCGYLGDWGHQGQCGEPKEHTFCIRCDADDVVVANYDRHIGEFVFSSEDEDYHSLSCSVCGDVHYAEEHKSARGCDDSFGTCALCGAEGVNLHGQLTYEEYIEDGILIVVSYTEDGGKWVEYYDAETREFHGWERYINEDDEEPDDWERRSEFAYDEENDRLTCKVETPAGSTVNTYRISDGYLVGIAGFDGNFFFEQTLSDEGFWYIAYSDSDHRIFNLQVCTEDRELISEQFFEYDAQNTPGSMLVRTWQDGVEVAQDFYTSADDAEPSWWEHYFDIVFEQEELDISGRVDVHRSYITSQGDYGTDYYRIDDGGWILCYEERFLGNGISRITTVWSQEEEVFYLSRWDGERPMFSNRLTPEWTLLTSRTWVYYEGVGPVVNVSEWKDGRPTCEKIYPNIDDESTYEERIFAEDGSCIGHTFTVCGVMYDAGQSAVTLPESTQVIESQAFAGTACMFVILPPSVTSIAGDAFPGSTVLLVPNEAVARLAVDAGYIWFFI